LQTCDEEDSLYSGMRQQAVEVRWHVRHGGRQTGSESGREGEAMEAGSSVGMAVSVYRR